MTIFDRTTKGPFAGTNAKMEQENAKSRGLQVETLSGEAWNNIKRKFENVRGVKVYVLHESPPECHGDVPAEVIVAFDGQFNIGQKQALDTVLSQG